MGGKFKLLGFKATLDDQTAIKRAASEAGLTVSEYLRAKVQITTPQKPVAEPVKPEPVEMHEPVEQVKKESVKQKPVKPEPQKKVVLVSNIEKRVEVYSVDDLGIDTLRRNDGALIR